MTHLGVDLDTESTTVYDRHTIIHLCRTTSIDCKDSNLCLLCSLIFQDEDENSATWLNIPRCERALVQRKKEGSTELCRGRRWGTVVLLSHFEICDGNIAGW